MELIVLNPQFEAVSILDSFESLIWTDRYSKHGDFEIYTPINRSIIDACVQDNYLWYKDSEHVMIVESILAGTDIEAGKTVTITGRSIESILYRRIVWSQTILSGGVQAGIKKILMENAIAPTDPARVIPNLIFEDSTDPAITGLPNITAQYTGDYVYDVVNKLCEYFGIGFKITLNSNNQFVFKLYAGVDRSYSQMTNPYVVFSPNFENIIDSKYLESKKTLKNVTLVAGEGEGSARRTLTIGNTTGMERRELFTDARDISSTVNNTTISDAEYNAQLEQRGYEKLVDYQIARSFDGQVEATQMFKYGRDFFLGDTVQVVNEYGIESKSRIDEIVRSQDKEGYNVYPTFTILKED